MLQTLAYVAGCQCQMCLEYSQQFSIFADVICMPPQCPVANSQQGTVSFPQSYQNNASPKAQNSDRAPKHARVSSLEQTFVLIHGSLSLIFSDNVPLTTCTRDKAVITAPASSIIYIPMKECNVKECEEDIPNSLTVCMGEKFLWEKDCNMVSLGSPTKVLDSAGGDFVSNAYNSSYFMENGIRYASLPHESKTDTYTYLVLNH